MFQSTDIHLLQATAKFRSDGRPIDINREHWQSLPIDKKSSPVFRFRRFIRQAFTKNIKN